MTGDEDNAGPSLERSSPASARRSPATGRRSSPTALTGRERTGRRYKTELCHQFEENGQCCYGSRCQFAHGRAELRSVARHPKYKTDLCRTFHTTGLCPYGPRCHFIHNDEDRVARFSDASLKAPLLLGVDMEFEGDRHLLGLVLLAAAHQSNRVANLDFPMPAWFDLHNIDVHQPSMAKKGPLGGRSSSSSSSSSPGRSCGSVASSSRSTSRSASFSDVRNWSLVD